MSKQRRFNADVTSVTLNERLRGENKLCSFSVIFTRETIFMSSSLLSAYQATSEKAIYLKRKEFAPIGSKFFPLKYITFQKGDNPFWRNKLN